MRIEAYEKPSGWPIARVHGLENDLDAEAFIKGRCDEAMFADVITWILFDEKGIRCIWERFPGDPELPIVSERSQRYCGQWTPTVYQQSIAIH